MVLVANKVDLVHLRKITSEQGQEMAAKHNVAIYTQCACVRVSVCACVRVCVCVCVGWCACVNEEREYGFWTQSILGVRLLESKGERERERERGRGCVCV